MTARILIADDKVKWVKMLAELLTGHGYTVTTADNGHDALARAMNEHPDLLVLDYAMPSFTGKEVAQVLRKEKQFSKTPIIFVSAHDEPFLAGDIEGLDPCVFMPKPVNPDEVLNRIQGLLSVNKS